MASSEVNGVQQLNHRTNMIITRLAFVVGLIVLVVVIGIGIIVVTLALDFAEVVESTKGVVQQTREQSIVNEIRNLDHSIRAEECIVAQIQDIKVAASEDRPLTSIPACRRVDTKMLQKRLDRAEARLKALQETR